MITFKRGEFEKEKLNTLSSAHAVGKNHWLVVADGQP